MKTAMEMVQEADVEILVKLLSPHYQPSPNPTAMCVGAISFDEAWVIREFNRKQYGAETTRVAACNIMPLADSPLRESYDFKVFNRFAGDARMDFPFIDALFEFDAEKFDLVYIRNPDLVFPLDWAHIFQRALQWTKPEGAVATLVIDQDLGQYSLVLGFLEMKGIKPAFSGPTGVKVEWKEPVFPRDYHHTLGVFKPE